MKINPQIRFFHLLNGQIYCVILHQQHHYQIILVSKVTNIWRYKTENLLLPEIVSNIYPIL